MMKKFETCISASTPSTLCVDAFCRTCRSLTEVQLEETKCVFKLFSPSFSHESHGPAHGEDGGRRSRRRPRGDALLLQGQDGQPRSRASLHKGGQLQILPIGDVTIVPQKFNLLKPFF